VTAPKVREKRRVCCRRRDRAGRSSTGEEVSFSPYVTVGKEGKEEKKKKRGGTCVANAMRDRTLEKEREGGRDAVPKEKKKKPKKKKKKKKTPRVRRRGNTDLTLTRKRAFSCAVRRKEGERGKDQTAREVKGRARAPRRRECDISR